MKNIVLSIALTSRSFIIQRLRQAREPAKDVNLLKTFE